MTAQSQYVIVVLLDIFEVALCFFDYAFSVV